MNNPLVILNYLPEVTTLVTYLSITLALSIVGYILPIPEEILLLLVGYATALDIINPYGALVSSFMGVIIGDNVLYFLSTRGNKHIQKLISKVNLQKLHTYQHHMHQHAGKTIFISRFIPGLRFLGPVIAGSIEVSWATFMFYNTLAILIAIPVLIALGYHFHTQIAVLITKVQVIRHIIFFSVLSIIGILISLSIGKKFLKKD